MKRIIYTVLILTLLITTASAESGTLTVTGSTSGFNTEFLHAGASLNTNFSMIYFLNGTYNGIASFTLHGSGFSNAPGGHQAETTHFTVIRGGSGDGYVSYNNLAKRIDWLPTSPLVITEGPVVFEYDHNIFANITFQAKNTLCSAPLYTLDATHPITFTAVGDPTKCLGEGGGVYQYDYDVRTSVTNDYVITYPAAGIFKTQILKAGETVTSKIAILNFTTVLFQESSFNTESFEYTTTYNNGIKLSLETAGTLFNNITVNSSGTIPTPGQAGTNQTTITKPDTGVNIAFDKSSYFVGDNVNISYWFSDTEWDALGAKYMNIYLNDVLKEDISGIFNHGLNSQSGFYIYSATSSGTLKAEVVREIVFISKNTWDESVEILPPGNSWIALSNSTSYAKLPVNVTYHLGYSVQAYPPAAIEIQTIDSATGIKVDNVFPDIFPDGVIPIGVIHPFPPGNYSIRLYDVVKNQVLDVKTLQVVLQPSAIPVLGIATSSISTDKGIYFYNDYMQVTFQVDDVNFSNYSIRGEIFDVNNSLVTKRIYSPFTDQVGTYTTIVNIDKKQKCENGLNCWFNTGNNTIYMVAYNSTNFFNIAHANFTVSSTTSDGYGLQVSTITPSANVPFQVTTIVPSLHTGVLVVANDGYKKIVYAVNQTVASGTSTIPVIITPVNNNGVAYYVAELWGDDGLLKVKIPLTVSQPVVTTTPTTSSGTALQVTGFISSNIFWALMFIIGFMLAIAVYERRGQ